MKKPHLVLEDTSPASRRALFRFAGVTWAATRYAWLSPLFWTALGVALAFAEQRNGTVEGKILIGCGYGLMLYASNVIHSVGHRFRTYQENSSI